jgi:hypothetical protein
MQYAQCPHGNIAGIVVDNFNNLLDVTPLILNKHYFHGSL